ncbi:hypothetical protein I2I05_08665 [Hymenobacter sp. BT683]|uniref:Uncharacterized protein n=1 Tax=Hymenobacter jeongseonensis TaxID=2791027 RepID=A0ABS0IHE0_9BACT|nr:hypothetical protein [Hymenobacter jeongseonensis]MBF9237469.1 hypothetical protein [Hymenobacter jeongseonensis]
MAKQTLQEKLLALLEEATKASAPASTKTVKSKDVTKALGMLKKSRELADAAYALLAGDGGNDENQSEEYKANVALRSFAPFGRRTDGTPKKGSGQAVGNADDLKLQELYPDLYTSGDKPKSEKRITLKNLRTVLVSDSTADNPGHGGSNKPGDKVGN